MTFADLGTTSLLGVRFLDRINRTFGLRLGVEFFFENPTPAAFAALVERSGPARAAAPELRVVSSEERPRKGIAIIGMAGRFGSASSVGEFWQALEAGRSLVREVPPERWSAAQHWDPEPGKPLRTISKWGAFLDGIDRFDADFFSISPKEAAAMDPQQRLFLEQAWLALENAGYPQGSLKGRQVGVYVGASSSGYEATVGAADRAADAYLMTGNLASLLASRIAYFLDLRGPALTIDTACSSALVAVDLARQALERGEIEMALVGGVSLFLDEKPFLLMSRAGMLAADGRCKSFDARADGIVLGEAVGAVILKPVAKALADGDRIDAVMLASGTNQDGHSNGITAPNSEAQAELIRTVVARAGVPAWSVGYVEAHGTGPRSAIRSSWPGCAVPSGLGRRERSPAASAP